MQYGVGSQTTNQVYEPQDMNRYESVDNEALQYDARGNTEADGITGNSYTYDMLSRQTQVINSGAGVDAEYVYDALGRRVAKDVDGVGITYYLYDKRFRILEERSSQTVWTHRFTYGDGVDEPLLLEQNGGDLYYYHRDALGSVTELTDETGALVEQYQYDVYGTPETLSTVGNPYLFTGRQYDPESGNYYYRARLYSPALGRFLSMDPLGFDAGDANLYRYVGNNPLNYTDSSGKVVDIALDATFVWYDLLMIGVHATFECGDMQKDLTMLGLDLLSLLLPFVTGLGQVDNAARGGSHIDDLIGAGDNLVDDALGAGDNLGDNIGQHGDDIPIPRCGFNSFSAETPVMTADGLLAISAVAVGDYVLAYDEATGAVGFYPVLATWVHEDPVIAYLVIEGELIETTPDHPFYTEDGDWVTAGELEAGDQIRQADGRYGTVETIELVYQLQPMYNLTVAAAHTFFVGDGQWLVHNSCRIDVEHIFHGKINQQGRAVGFHHEGEGIGHLPFARVIEGTRTAPNSQGVYKAFVEIYDESTGTWVRKNAPSSFFPKTWSRQQVVNEIWAAFGSSSSIAGKPSNYWEGISSNGIRIGGYLNKATGDIATAFPIY